MKNTPEETFKRLLTIPLDLNRVEYASFEMENVCHQDYPDFCDAFIVYAEFEDGTELTEDQMEQLNENTDIVYQAAIDSVFF